MACCHLSVLVVPNGASLLGDSGVVVSLAKLNTHVVALPGYVLSTQVPVWPSMAFSAFQSLLPPGWWLEQVVALGVGSGVGPVAVASRGPCCCCTKW